MRIPKRDYWTERGFKTREEWLTDRNEKNFIRKCKICNECGNSFKGNKSYCSMKCTLKAKTIKKENDCIEWQGCKDSCGYGLIRNYENRKLIRTHRLSYELFNGEIPEGILVLHKCDNPPCCNPDHLFLGNYKDNMRDATDKGRLYEVGKNNFGEKASRAKLKEYEVKEIISLIENEVKILEIAEKYGVHVQTIYAIKYKYNWKSLS